MNHDNTIATTPDTTSDTTPSTTSDTTAHAIANGSTSATTGSVGNIWCTLVMLNDSYACGAAVLAQSLRDMDTIYPVWCMVTECVSAPCVEFLKTHFDRVITVPLISHKCIAMKTRKQNQIYGRWIHASFTKWNILNPMLFPGINKVVLLDADMMVLQNIDDLFDLPSPALTFSTPWARPYGQNKKSGGNYSGTVNRYFNSKYEREPIHGQIISRKAIMESLENGFVGLACMVLVTPNISLYESMLSILSYKPSYGETYCISGFDEQLIAETLLTANKPIYHIHQQYNWIVGKVKWLQPGVLPKTQQFYNGKPWDNITDSTSRYRIVESSQWNDIRSWWQSADRIINQYPADSKWFYTGGTICTHSESSVVASNNIVTSTTTIPTHADSDSEWKVQRKKKEYIVDRNGKWR